jgi:transposase
MEDDLMAKELVSDELWAIVEPILPKHRPSRKGGQPPVGNRVCLAGILFVLKTGLPWEDFPQEMGCCGMTLWNRLSRWKKLGVLTKLHRILFDKLRGADQIDFSRVIADSSSVRAVHGGKKQAQIQRIDAKPAPNITCLSMQPASRWSAV